MISGHDEAQFKGTGTINGAGELQLPVTAIDGDQFTGAKKPDSFRIKITTRHATWSTTTRSAPTTLRPSATVLGGGSIQIQSK